MSDGAYIEDEEEFVDELKPGTELMLGQYTIHSFLAAGGFGITYLAKDSLDRYVVIKECFPGSFCRRQNASVLPRSRAHQNELKSIVRMFSQEAMSLSKAGHPNIVGVHQVFEENNTAYMALDYVKGSDLLEILTDHPDWLTPELVQGFLKKVLSAVGHIHDQGILHRDISPDNIIISESGEPVLIDFGAAREEAGGQASRLLSALRVVKDGYSPQEFYIAGSEQTNSCDLYSLAASFYHIITGELPPDSQSRLTAFAANEADPYVPLASRGLAYPDNFATALDKAMSVLPKDRMQSAAEWQAHMDGEVTSA
ncbi:MAG: serine/threonine-protein kinase, partial [Pseudomonadota bacterium]